MAPSQTPQLIRGRTGGVFSSGNEETSSPSSIIHVLASIPNWGSSGFAGESMLTPATGKELEVSAKETVLTTRLVHVAMLHVLVRGTSTAGPCNLTVPIIIPPHTRLSGLKIIVNSLAIFTYLYFCMAPDHRE